MWSVRDLKLDMDTGNPRFLQSRNKTYVYLWTYRQFKVELKLLIRAVKLHLNWKLLVCNEPFVSVLQQEQVEWDDVNKLLQHHGFKPVFFADPVENESLSSKSHTISIVGTFSESKYM